MKVALVGNPNSGKTTLFNALTGLNQKVANFPGITVDKKVGACQISQLASKNKVDTEFIDLPGTYSLYPKSVDESVSFQILCDSKNEHHPDVNIIIADASNLKRSLCLATQVIDLNTPCILALSMMDLTIADGVEIDISLLSEQLGIPVVPINARKKIGIGNLKQAIIKVINDFETPKSFVDIKNLAPELIGKIQNKLTLKSDYNAFQIACNYKTITGISEKEKTHFEELSKELKFNPKRSQATETVRRYKAIDKLIELCIKYPEFSKNNSLTQKLDNILTHPILGFGIFLAVLFLIFQAVFSWSEYPMELIDNAFAQLSQFVANSLPDGALNSLIVDGIIAGLGGIVIFVPQIAFLFAFIAILEDTGYMSRVSFITDKLLRGFGLSGRSIIPLLSGAACAIPAVMSARTIPNWKERIITIMVVPLMSCAARLPVYTLLISMMIPAEQKWLIFNLQGLTMMGFYLIGFVSAISIAWMMKYILESKERGYFVMEMPTYKVPDWKTVGLTIFEKVKVFLIDAGKIIVAISIVLWGLSSYGPSDKFQKIEEKYQYSENAEVEIASEKLEASYAGIIGKSIEPVIRPLGFDWRIGISLITSFAAREVFVGTMSTIYSVGDADNTKSIREKLMSHKNPKTGEAFFTPAVALSLMLFYAFAMQCMSTLAIVFRETNSWKWPIIQFVYMSLLAYLASFAAYQILS
ncbi:MAG: ferrous iron transport protein B [Flavobacteriales bacterium]|nr:ferrous iron transport protein B [Flavobacteriales bacterium]MBL6873214.1 ferrous iron transport protein B [Flavobacteriales bacterium]